MDIEKAQTFDLNDHILAKNVSEVLDKKYPGWL